MRIKMQSSNQISESEQIDIINNQEFLKLVLAAQSQVYGGLTMASQDHSVPTSMGLDSVFRIFSNNEFLSELKVNSRNPLSKFREEIALFSLPMLLKLFDAVKQEKHMLINGVQIKYPNWVNPRPKYQTLGIIYQALREKLRNAPAIISTAVAFKCHQYGRDLLSSTGQNARKMIRQNSYYYYAKRFMSQDISKLQQLLTKEKNRQENKNAVSKAELLGAVYDELDNKISADGVINPLALTIFLEEKLQQLMTIYEREAEPNESSYDLAFAHKTSIQILRTIIAKLCGQYLEKDQLVGLIERFSPSELLSYARENANEINLTQADAVVAESLPRGRWPFFYGTPAHAEVYRDTNIAVLISSTDQNINGDDNIATPVAGA